MVDPIFLDSLNGKPLKKHMCVRARMRACVRACEVVRVPFSPWLKGKPTGKQVCFFGANFTPTHVAMNFDGDHAPKRRAQQTRMEQHTCSPPGLPLHTTQRAWELFDLGL